MDTESHHPKHAASPPAIDVRNLDVSRSKTPILHGITLSVPTGAIVGLLGPSGCGKTTLMRTIVGVQKIARGSVTVLGMSAGSRELRGRIGYVTQAAAVYPDLSVRDNVSYFAQLTKAHDRVTDTIGQVGLAAHERQAVSTLSGGEASRASLACALVGDPDVLILDEPTVGLDPVTREDLWDHFHGLASAGRTLMVSSHVMDEASRCDVLVLMRQGRVLAQLTPTELLERTGASSPDEAFLRLVRRGGDDQ